MTLKAYDGAETELAPDINVNIWTPTYDPCDNGETQKMGLNIFMLGSG